MGRRIKESLLVAGIGVILPLAMYITIAGLVSRSPPDRPMVSSPRLTSGDQEQAVMVLLIAQSCDVSGRSDVRTGVSRLHRTLTDSLAAKGIPLWTVGVAVDVDPVAGLEALSVYPWLHEVIAGGGWLNSGVRRFVWESDQVPPRLPQAVFVRRRLQRDVSRVSFEDDEIVLAVDLATISDLDEVDRLVVDLVEGWHAPSNSVP
jgi:hypothetical protein